MTGYHAVLNAAGVRVPLNAECVISIPPWRPVGTVEQTPTGRTFLSTTARLALPAQATVTWVVRGATPEHADEELADMVRLLDGATRLYHGDAYLTVLRLAERSAPTPGIAGLRWSGSHTYDLAHSHFTDAQGRTGPMPARLTAGGS